ncbi:MAG: hypothetical protein KGM24_08295 [Elusimicrobia bacterium]|nr:hypothetical protein [Elusimicrobiota bacterium]
MNRTKLLMIALLLGVALPAAANVTFTPQSTAPPGSVPQGIDYQGRLDDNGVPVTGTQKMVFRVYDASTGGTLIWTSPAQFVDVSIGLFNAVVPVPITALVGGGARYMEVEINGTTMSPRELLNSVPYALIAKSIEGTIEVSTAGLSILPNGSATTPSLTISSTTGGVGIGAAVPAPGSVFSVGASTLVVANGSVGVGTASPDPGSALDVGGQAQFGSGATKSTFTATGNLLVPGRIGAAVSAPLSALDVGGAGLAVGAYGGVNAAPSDGLIVSGGVGVGTPTPATPLDVEGASQFGTAPNKSTFTATGSLQVPGSLEAGGATGTTNNLDVLGQAAIGTYAGVNAAPSDGLIVSGWTGIATTSPGAALDVGGDAQFGSMPTKSTFTATGSLQVPGSVEIGGLTGTTNALDVKGGAAVGTYAGTDAAGSGNLIVSGDVGIGTATPSVPLAVYTGGGFAADLVHVNSGAQYLALGSNDLSNFSTLRSYNSSLGSEPLILNDIGGGVGVGTTGPGATLDVNGDAQFGSGSAKSTFTATGSLQVPGSIEAGGATGTTNALDVKGGAAIGTYAGANAAGSGNLIVSGGVGIGTNSPGADALDVVGSAKLGAAGTQISVGTTGSVTLADFLQLKSDTLATLQALAPSAVGQVYYCSNCVPPKVVVATGTAAGNFADAVGGTFQ